MAKLCEVCGNTDHKYKCPTCYIRYCSLKCFKQHKVVSCFPKEEVAQKFNAPKQGRILLGDGLSCEDDSEDMVPKEKLAKLGHSKDIKELLENPHLQDILRHLDASQNPDDDVTNAMQEPLFLEFADACLSVIEPELLRVPGST